MAKDADAGAGHAAGTDGNKDGKQGGAESDEDFDKERALDTIRKQRESEKAAKEKAKTLEEELAKYKTAEEQKAEAEKALEVKVAERDSTIESLNGQIADLHIEHDFFAKAQAQGVADPGLAYLAAKEQGLLGAYDPKAGTVGDHDFEKLGEKYPSFAVSREANAGDAGKSGRGKTMDAAAQFNQAIRAGRR